MMEKSRAIDSPLRRLLELVEVSKTPSSDFTFLMFASQLHFIQGSGPAGFVTSQQRSYFKALEE
jgi:hypothetical protein